MGVFLCSFVLSVFLHIGTDRVILSHAGVVQELSRFGIEKTLGSVLVDWYRKTAFSSLLVFNGPSGFTSLRVGTLVGNLLASLLAQEKKTLTLWSCDKVTLYRYLVVKKKLPACGLFYLGQKKGVWLSFFDTYVPETVDKHTLGSLLSGREFFYEEVAEEGYWDSVAPFSGGSVVSVRGGEGYFEVAYRDQIFRLSFEELGMLPQDMISAIYSAPAI